MNSFFENFRSDKIEVNGMDISKHSQRGVFSNEKKEPNAKDYARNAPKIMLEIISARMATVVILLTYAVFIIGFLIDVLTTFQSFESNDKYLSSQVCPSYANLSLSNYDNYGCYYGNTWYGIIKNLENVISVQLDAERYNITLAQYNNEPSIIIMNVDLYACYQSNGCGNSFTGYGSHQWMPVLSQTNKSREPEYYANGQYASVNIFPNTFQNQESIPSEGLVKSYYIKVEYLYDNNELFTSQDTDIYYKFDVVSRPKQQIKNIFIVIIMFFSLIIFGGYVYVVYTCHRDANTHWLSEQKWLVIYFFAVILYQNPVTIVIDFSQYSTPTSAYSSYTLDSLAQTLLFVIWLMFADSIHRTYTSQLKFYGPKVFFGFVIMSVSIFVTTCQFPSLDPASGGTRNPVEAVSDWSYNLKVGFCISSVAFILLQWLWTATWFFNIYLSHKTLNKLPYMSTRYLQLSHRFFTVQALSVTLYYVCQYVVVIYLISSHDTSERTTLTNLTDNINTLFREQAQLFGKILFLTTYAIVLAFLFLPVTFSDNRFVKNNFFNATFVISEAELVVERNRRLLVRHRALHSLNPVGFLSSLTANFTNKLLNAKIDVFCVDIALITRDLSFQAYYDPDGLKTQSSYEGRFDVESHGFKMIEALYCEEHQAFCFIVREVEPPRRIFVVFRGTVSQRQMKDNLNFKRRHINIFTCRLPALDEMDGLTPDPKDSYKLSHPDAHNIVDILQEPIDPYFGARIRSASQSFVEGDDLGIDFDYRQMDTSVSAKIESHPKHFRETIIDGAVAVEKGVVKVASNVKDAASTVIDATTEAVVGAAHMTPGLQQILRTSVHTGFWDAYESSLRIRIHAILRRELTQEPSDIFFTGHSLGGALATFCAIDFSIHSLPRIKSHLRHLSTDLESQGHGYTMTTLTRASSVRLKVNNIHVGMYNFGSPKVGNGNFAQLYDKIVPNSFRVVVDGDLVTGLPLSRRYRHIGTCVVIDNAGAGSIIVDPSFVEVWLRIQSKSSVANHSLLIYDKGLLGVKNAAMYIESLTHQGNVDMKSLIKLSLNEKQARQIVEQRITEPIQQRQSISYPKSIIHDTNDSVRTNETKDILIDQNRSQDIQTISIQLSSSPDAIELNSSPMHIHKHLDQDDGLFESVDHVPYRQTSHELLNRSPFKNSSKRETHHSAHTAADDRDYPDSITPHRLSSADDPNQIDAETTARHLANDVRNVEYLLSGMKQFESDKKAKSRKGLPLPMIPGKKFGRFRKGKSLNIDADLLHLNDPTNTSTHSGGTPSPAKEDLTPSSSQVESTDPIQPSETPERPSILSWNTLRYVVQPIIRLKRYSNETTATTANEANINSNVPVDTESRLPEKNLGLQALEEEDEGIVEK